MKGLECPYCNKQMLSVWRLFVLPPVFFAHQPCMHCHRRAKINWQALLNVMLAIAVAAVVGMLIDKVFSFESMPFDIVMYVFATYLPFLLGQELFVKDEARAKSPGADVLN